jgi:hypothetical protein
MKKLELALFSGALAVFFGVALEPTSTHAQMANWCPGGSTLLCGTDKTSSCIEIDQCTGSAPAGASRRCTTTTGRTAAAAEIRAMDAAAGSASTEPAPAG